MFLRNLKFVLFSALFLVLIVQQGLALDDSGDQVPAASSPRRSSSVHHHQRQSDDDDGSQGPRTPYSFGYDFTDELGNRQQRTETSDERGVVQGSYSYSDADGVSRIVNYVADEHGYRASVNTNEPGVRSHSPASVYIESSAATVDGGDEQTGSSSGLYPSTFVLGQDDQRGQRSASGGQRARSQRQRQQRTQQAEPVPRQQTVSGGGHQPVPQRQQQRVPVQPEVGVAEQEVPQRQNAAPVEVGHHRGVHHQQQQLPAIQPIVLPEILEQPVQPVPVPQQIGQYARSQPTSSRARARHHVRQSFPLVAAAMFGANNFYEAERLHHQIE